MVFTLVLGVSMILSVPIIYIIIHVHATSDKRALFGDKLQSNEDDNPLLLTIKSMEGELAELKENNTHMERIAQLEKDIKEANKHAEALSKVAGNYGNTTKEVGEAIAGGIGGRNVVHTVTPNSEKLDDESTRQELAHFRTYTKQAGWSSYYDVTDVKLKLK